MFHGTYISPLSEIYHDYKHIYMENKDNLKNNTPIMIKSFMQNFMKFQYLNQIKNSITYDNILDFVNTYFDEFIKNKKKLIDCGNEELCNEELNKISQQNEYFNIFQDSHEILYLKFFFFENCLDVMKMMSINFNYDQFIEILTQFFKNFLINFDSSAILTNIKLFNFYLKNIFKLTLKFLDTRLSLQTLIENSHDVHQTNPKKNLILNLLFIKNLFKFELTNSNIKYISSIYLNNLNDLIDLLVWIKKYIRIFLPDTSEKIQITLHNNIIKTFKRIFEKIKVSVISLYEKSEESFLLKLREIPAKEYESFVFIFTNILNDIKLSGVIDEKRLDLLILIFQSNQPLIHILAVDFLEKIRESNFIDNNFIAKFISVFDVLDGYNSHLFKQLWPDLKFIILFCENYKDEIYKDKIFLKQRLLDEGECHNMMLLNSGISIKEFFSIPFNYFFILTNKILNHENSNIQKFLIKSFSSICTDTNLSNKNFEDFIYNTLIKMLNNPVFYPENESISYHAKVGVLAEKLFSRWLMNCLQEHIDRFENNLNKYLDGIYNFIEYKRALPYLMNAIYNTLENYQEKKINLEQSILSVLYCIIEKNMKNLSLFQRQKSWEAIGLILKNSHIKEKIPIEAIKIFNSLVCYLIYKDSITSNSITSISIFDGSLFNLFVFFEILFSQLYISLESVEFEDFSITLSHFKSKNSNFILLSENLDQEVVILLFWFIYVRHPIIVKQFLLKMKKICSPYIVNENKLFLMKNLKMILLWLDYINSNTNMITTEFNITEIYESLEEILINTIIYLSNYFTSFTKILSLKEEFGNTNEELFVLDNSDVFHSNLFKIFLLLLNIDDKVKDLNAYIQSNLVRCISNFILLESNKIVNTIISINLEINLTMNKLSCINFIVKYIEFIEIQVVFIMQYIKIKHENSDIIIKISALKLFLNQLEEILIKEKHTWLKNSCNIYNQCIYSIIRIKTLICMQLKELLDVSSNDKNILELCQYFFKTENEESSIEILIEYLEKSNDKNLYYIMKLVNFYIYFYISKDLDINFLSNYINTGLDVFITKRENLNFMNAFTFLSSIINYDIFTKSPETLALISRTISTICDMNLKRTWLVLKITCDLLFSVLNQLPNAISAFTNNIIELSESKETRGEDSFMLQTQPNFLFSPFNIAANKLIKNKLFMEDICKYGLYVRIKTIIFFSELKVEQNDKTTLNSILCLIEKILEIIKSNSKERAEMQFTTKHRKKLRLSQFLMILSKNVTFINSESSLNNIEKLTIDIFEKVNLSSVRFYLDLFSLKLAQSKISFLMYLINKLSDNKSKTHVLTSSLIILSILLINNKFEYELSVDLRLKIFELVTALCTSNICNVRGFAQYFICKFAKEPKLETFLNKDYISNFFYEYLNSNNNIQKFFNKFNETYEKYTLLIENCNVENLLNSNFDEVNCEIIPIDFIGEFKELSIHMVDFKNVDLMKPHISWKFTNDIDENNQFYGNIIQDFQKKYRPITEISRKKIRLNVVVMASLIDKAPNLGGLVRTCEVFNIGAMTISSEAFLNDNGFLTAAASADKWLPILNLPTSDIESFIKGYKKIGYNIIGLEQTANSISLKDFTFQEKCIIVLGNEKEGIPQNLIQLIDHCIEIPQFGEIRSLNVHVSAALMLWELVNQCN